MLVADVDVFSTVTILSIWIASIVIVFATVQKLWVLRWNAGRDNGIDLPLPKGSMGLPVVGETFHWFMQVRRVHLTPLETLWKEVALCAQLGLHVGKLWRNALHHMHMYPKCSYCFMRVLLRRIIDFGVNKLQLIQGELLSMISSGINAWNA